MKLPQELLDKITFYLDFEINVILNTNNINKKYMPNAHTFRWAIRYDLLDVLKWLEKNKDETYTSSHLHISMKYKSDKCFSYLINKENIEVNMDALFECINKRQFKEIERRLSPIGLDNQKKIMNNAVITGSIEIFEFCKSLGYFHAKEEILQIAIRNKKLDFIKFLYSQGYTSDCIRIYDYNYDNIKIFKFLYMHYPDVKIIKPSYRCSYLDDFIEIYGEQSLFFEPDSNAAMGGIDVSRSLYVRGELRVDGVILLNGSNI